MYFVSVDHERCGESGQNLVGQRRGVRDLAQLWLYQRKFVPANPRQRVRCANLRRHALGHVAQETISGRVTQCIVGVLEPIEIEGEDGDRATVTAGERHCLPQAVVHQHTVRQAGQRVMQRLASDPLLGGLALGKVLEHGHLGNDLPGRHRKSARC